MAEANTLRRYGAVASNKDRANVDELKLLKKQIEQMRQDTVKCPNTTDLYAVVAYDKVLRAIDEMMPCQKASTVSASS